MAEFQTGLPSTRQVQTAIRDKKDVELKLLTDDLIVGKVSWQDQDCICIVDHYDQPTIVWRHAIAYLKPKA
ncbi:MAG: RNA-binding protein hfq [Cyanobacteria bacterium P01_H01_bin.130]